MPRIEWYECHMSCQVENTNYVPDRVSKLRSDKVWVYSGFDILEPRCPRVPPQLNTGGSVI
jgi:hypothetical protein